MIHEDKTSIWRNLMSPTNCSDLTTLGAPSSFDRQVSSRAQSRLFRPKFRPNQHALVPPTISNIPTLFRILSTQFILNITRTVRGSDYSPAIELSEQEDKLVTVTGDTEKYSEKQANKVWLNSVYWFSLSENEILTSIKGCNSVANLRNLTLYNPNLDIIDVNVYTKFG